MFDRPVTLAFDGRLGFRPHDVRQPSLVHAFLNPVRRAAPSGRPIGRGWIAANRSKFARQRERTVRPLTTTTIF